MKSLITALIISITFFNCAFAYDYFESGKSYFKKGNYLKANQLFKKELEKNPDNIKCRYFYAQSFIGINNVKNAQSEYEKIIELAPNSQVGKLSSIALSRIHEYYNPQIQTAVAKKTTKSKASVADNYIVNAQSNGKIVRWNIAFMPIKIYLENAVNVPGYRTYYYSMVQSAIGTWLKVAEPRTISVTFVSNPDDADITINFVSEVGKQNANSYLIGLATPSIKGYRLESCSIKLRATDANGGSFSQKEIYLTALHEFGHALGIWGHSSRKTDIMYDNDSGNSINASGALSQRDINTLKLLYWLDPDISNFAPGEVPVANSAKNKALLGDINHRIGSKYEEARSYLNKYPGQPLSWSNLGDVYLNAKQYKEAISCYNQALILDSSYTAARSNLAIAYDKTGDLNNALSQFYTLVRQDPQNIGYSYNFALFLRKNNMSSEASQVINNLIRANPSASNDKNVQSMMNGL